jgi:acetyltransferase
MQPVHNTHLRSVHLGDRERLSAFLRRLSQETVKARYMGGPAMVGFALERELARLLSKRRASHTVLVALADNEIRGIAEYVVEAPGRAEVGIVVEDEFQGRGIGTRLLRLLTRRAKARGIQMLTGDVAAGNYRMLKLLRRSGQAVRLEFSYASVRFELGLDEVLVLASCSLNGTHREMAPL